MSSIRRPRRAQDTARPESEREPDAHELRALADRFDDLHTAYRAGRPSAELARMPLERVELELWRVHQIEAARLLTDAAALRIGARSSREARSIGEVEEWHARARELIESARECASPLPAVLARCVARPWEDWPGAVHLLRAALRLDPCAALRNALKAAVAAQAQD